MRCAKLGWALVALLLARVVLLEPVPLMAAAAAVPGRLELISVLTLLAQADCWLMTLAQPEQAVATAGWLGCEVATAGMPVMIPSELVMVVYIVNGFEYGTEDETALIDTCVATAAAAGEPAAWDDDHARQSHSDCVACGDH